jgi:tetratricopeptide (TPR) repeat protein
MYRRARRLAPTETRAATLLARGRMLDERGKPRKARDCYDAALKIDPENPVHWAHLASAHAADHDAKKARRLAESALNELAPIYRRTLELHHPAALLAMRDNTLAALRRTYTTLEGGATRIDRIETLWVELEEATAQPDVDALVKLKNRFDDAHVWEREQVQIALARTLGRLGRWDAARDEYAELIAMLEARRPQGIVQHSLHAKQAKALRRTGDYHEALVRAARGQLQDPLSASARREVGKAHFALLQYEQALDAWEHTLWLTPNDPYLHWKVAFCHWSVAQDRRDPAARRASLEAAADGFEQAATLFGVRILKGWAWSQLWAGRVRAELGDHDDAVRHLRSATGCAQTELAGALLLGEEYRTVGDRSLSRLHFERAYDAVSVRLDGGNVDADWGETLPSREVAVRAAVGLGLCDLESGGDYGTALERAAEAADLAAELEDEPRAAARCSVAVADLTARAGRAAERNGHQNAFSR